MANTRLFKKIIRRFAAKAFYAQARRAAAMFPPAAMLSAVLLSAALISCPQTSDNDAVSSPLMAAGAVSPALSISGASSGSVYIAEVFSITAGDIPDAAAFAAVTARSNLLAQGEAEAEGSTVRMPLLTADGSAFNRRGEFTVVVIESAGGLRNITMKYASASFTAAGADLEWYAMTPAPDYAISLDAPALYSFPPVRTGGVAQSVPPLTVRVSNAGNNETGPLKVSLDGTDADIFILSSTALASVPSAGSAEAFTVTPKTPLPEGNYHATVTVSGENGVSASFSVTQRVTLLPFYTVSFDTGNGSAMSARYVIEGELLETPDRLYLAGHTFDGWFTDAEGLNRWDFERDAVTANMMLFAKWTPIKVFYSVTFEIPGFSPVVEQIERGYTVGRPAAPVRTEWTFVDWYADFGRTALYDFNRAVTANINVYAKWTAKEYTVSFRTADGTLIAEQLVPYGRKLALEGSVPTQNGASFMNWYKEPSCVNPWNFGTDTVTSDTSVYALFAANTAVVRFDGSMGGAAYLPQLVPLGSLAQEPAIPPMNHYTFDGWYTQTSGGVKWSFTQNAVTENIILYARWSKKIYTVQFETKNGTVIPPQEVAYGERAVRPAAGPERTGLNFHHWANAAAGGANFDFTAPVTADTVVHAQYYATVSVYVNNDVLAEQYAVMENETLPENISASYGAAMDYYTLEGWYTAPNAAGTKRDPAVPVTADLSLYANFTPTEYSIVLDYNGGKADGKTTETLAINMVTARTVLNVIAGKQPSRDDHMGFNTWRYRALAGAMPDGSPLNDLVAFQADDFFKKAFGGGAASVTVYAEWLKQYRIQFTHDGWLPDAFTAKNTVLTILPAGTRVAPKEGDWEIWVTEGQLVPLPANVLEYYANVRGEKLLGFCEDGSYGKSWDDVPGTPGLWKFDYHRAWYDMELTGWTDPLGFYDETDWYRIRLSGF
jgi:uncharacterized repeat protein (TIGR02543 family)